jgi:Dyp-type peroxidase family
MTLPLLDIDSASAGPSTQAPDSDPPPIDLFQLIDTKSDSWNRTAQYLQGNIAKGHGRQHSALIAIEIDANKQPRKGLRELALRYVTSAHQQDERRRARKSQRGTGNIDTELFGFLYISIWGYLKLGYTESALSRAFADPEGARNWFLDGMRAHDMIHNADPLNWDSTYKNQHVDALLVLASDHPEALKHDVDAAIDQISSFGTRLGIEDGAVLRRGKQRIEPFGFVDSISKPDILEFDPTDLHAVVDSGSLPTRPVHLLVQDPLAHEKHAFGSYLVYCKLEQNVKTFRQAVKDLANSAATSNHRAEAMIIGRFRNGTPLSNPSGRHAVPNFIGAGGSKCPFQAHIRKVNPRVTIEGSPMSNPLFRRGVPYGSAATPPTGLLFLAFQSDIARQFGAIMAAWVNKLDFPVGGTGTDAMMGPPSGNQTWPPETGATPSTFDLSRHITMRGGEFFFAPSLACFQKLL